MTVSNWADAMRADPARVMAAAAAMIKAFTVVLVVVGVALELGGGGHGEEEAEGDDGRQHGVFRRASIAASAQQ